MNLMDHKDRYDVTRAEWAQKVAIMQDELSKIATRNYYSDEAQRRYDKRKVERELASVNAEYGERIAALQSEWNRCMQETIDDPKPNKSWAEIKQIIDSMP